MAVKIIGRWYLLGDMFGLLYEGHRYLLGDMFRLLYGGYRYFLGDMFRLLYGYTLKIKGWVLPYVADEYL